MQSSERHSQRQNSVSVNEFLKTRSARLGSPRELVIHVQYQSSIVTFNSFQRCPLVKYDVLWTRIYEKYHYMTAYKQVDNSESIKSFGLGLSLTQQKLALIVLLTLKPDLQGLHAAQKYCFGPSLKLNSCSKSMLTRLPVLTSKRMRNYSMAERSQSNQQPNRVISCNGYSFQGKAKMLAKFAYKVRMDKIQDSNVLTTEQGTQRYSKMRNANEENKQCETQLAFMLNLMLKFIDLIRVVIKINAIFLHTRYLFHTKLQMMLSPEPFVGQSRIIHLLQ